LPAPTCDVFAATVRRLASAGVIHARAQHRRLRTADQTEYQGLAALRGRGFAAVFALPASSYICAPPGSSRAHVTPTAEPKVPRYIDGDG